MTILHMYRRRLTADGLERHMISVCAICTNEPQIHYTALSISVKERYSVYGWDYHRLMGTGNGRHGDLMCVARFCIIGAIALYSLSILVGAHS